MSDPRRFRDGGDIELRALFDAGRSDRPSRGSVDRAVVVVGAVGAGLTAASAASAASASSGIGAASASAVTSVPVATMAAGLGAAVGEKAAAASVLFFAAKWGIIGAVVGGLSLGAQQQIAHRRSNRASIPATRSSASITSITSIPATGGTEPRDPGPTETVRALTPIRTTPLATAHADPASARSANTPATSMPAKPRTVGSNARSMPSTLMLMSPVPVPVLARELQSLERSRRALAQGDAVAALRALDAYAMEFPQGALVPEATMLRLESLCEANLIADATRLADSFVADQPSTPYAPRIRALRTCNRSPR